MQFDLGATYLNAGKYDEALAAFQKAAAADPSNPESYYHLGTIYVGMNKIAEARTNLEKYVSMNPTTRKTGPRPRGCCRLSPSSDRRPRGRRPERIARAAAARAPGRRDHARRRGEEASPEGSARPSPPGSATRREKGQEAEAKIAALADSPRPSAGGTWWATSRPTRLVRRLRFSTASIRSTTGPGPALEKAAAEHGRRCGCWSRWTWRGRTKVRAGRGPLLPASGHARAEIVRVEGSWASPLRGRPRAGPAYFRRSASCATPRSPAAAAGRRPVHGHEPDLEVAVEKAPHSSAWARPCSGRGRLPDLRRRHRGCSASRSSQ